MIVESDFPNHWKTTLLAELLGAGAPIGLIRLWGHCELRRTDSFALTTNQLAALVKMGGKPADVEAALIECRWIAREGERIIVLGWRERNAGWLAKVQAGRGRVAGSKRDDTGKLAPSMSPASKQLAGEDAASYQPASKQLAGGVEWSGVENSGEPPPFRADSAPLGGDGGSLSALTDTENFIIGLLAKPGKKSRACLSREAEAELGRQAASLPLTDSQKAMLTWFYGLPADPEDLDLRTRYRDANALAIHLFTALERAEAYAEKGHAPSAAASTEKKSRAPWPNGTRDWFSENYPAFANQHVAEGSDWWDLPESVRSEFELFQKGQKGAA